MIITKERVKNYLQLKHKLHIKLDTTGKYPRRFYFNNRKAWQFIKLKMTQTKVIYTDLWKLDM